MLIPHLSYTARVSHFQPTSSFDRITKCASNHIDGLRIVAFHPVASGNTGTRCPIQLVYRTRCTVFLAFSFIQSNSDKLYPTLMPQQRSPVQQTRREHDNMGGGQLAPIRMGPVYNHHSLRSQH